MIGPKAYIHLDRLKQNISFVKNEIGDRNLMVIVKANGYGHGALNISSYLDLDSNIIFAVFTIDEAIELRKGGIKNSILIFCRIQKEWLELACKYKLWINACDYEDLILLSQFYDAKGYCPEIHLKFDTGMTRLGFNVTDHEKIFQFINQNSFLNVIGIYSHFATADEGELSYAEYQLSLFNDILRKSQEFDINFQFIHCSNSGSFLNLPSSSFFNTVRVGMLIYGISPSNEVKMKVDFKPVMSFCGPIVNIRSVGPGVQVSYGGVYQTKKSTNIGVIQTGFADGFPRPWYKDGFISYKGKHYNIAGRVCMDQFMVDFGDTKPNIGDEVLIFGKKDNDEIPIEFISEKIDSTPYVLLTAIQGRTKRIIS